jgi:hypothetical protein
LRLVFVLDTGLTDFAGEVIALNSGPVVIDASPALASVPLVDQTRATGGSGARDSQHALSACADILRKERVTKEPLMLNERVYEEYEAGGLISSRDLTGWVLAIWRFH